MKVVIFLITFWLLMNLPTQVLACIFAHQICSWVCFYNLLDVLLLLFDNLKLTWGRSHIIIILFVFNNFSAQLLVHRHVFWRRNELWDTQFRVENSWFVIGKEGSALKYRRMTGYLRWADSLNLVISNMLLLLKIVLIRLCRW